MKLYLDDERSPPDSTWHLVHNADEAITLLEANPQIHTISLDYHLGENEYGDEYPTGYDVICWLEDRVYDGYPVPKTIVVHATDTSAHVKMNLGLDAINNFRGTCR